MRSMFLFSFKIYMSPESIPCNSVMLRLCV
uniref:Uncharacterized protein n=1 Tax=Anguilla anguilla TaxID=7936 RepID=A0A0E9REH1_ANGAN